MNCFIRIYCKNSMYEISYQECSDMQQLLSKESLCVPLAPFEILPSCAYI